MSAMAIGHGARLAVAAQSAFGAPRLSILIFHRVLREPDPLFPAEIDARRFDMLLGILRRAFRVLPLSQAVEGLRGGSLPRRALAITFDDGYADNHDVALPLLRKHGLSACFFIATGFLDGGRMFNDTVIECIRSSPCAQVDLQALGLGRLALGSPVERAAAIAAVLPKIKYLPPAERPQALARLQQLLRPSHLPDDLMMCSDQVRAMHAAGMEIGAHTVRHPILATLDDAQAEQELVESRDVLQALIGQTVDMFAYPNGRPGRDYRTAHADMVKRLGFKAAVSTAPGAASPGADLYQLPRFSPWDDPGLRWVARLLGARRGRHFEVATA